MGKLLLKSACFAIGYRYHDFLYPLRLPYLERGLDSKEIKEKARASSTVVGIFLAFLVTLLAVLAAGEKTDIFKKIKQLDQELVLIGVLGALIPFLALREERKISAAEWEAKAWGDRTGQTELKRKKKTLQKIHYSLLAVWTTVAVGSVLYITFPYGHSVYPEIDRALGLSGLVLVVGSLLLLVVSVELYDTAGSWARLNNVAYHFHMASIASHCYVFGFAMTLLGFSLLLCLAHLRIGCWLALVVLGFHIALTEVERELNHLPS